MLAKIIVFGPYWYRSFHSQQGGISELHPSLTRTFFYTGR